VERQNVLFELQGLQPCRVILVILHSLDDFVVMMSIMIYISLDSVSVPYHSHDTLLFYYQCLGLRRRLA
jgi:hypothetical protein